MLANLKATILDELDRYPWIRRVSGWVAVIAGTCGTLAAVVGNITTVQNFIRNAFGISGLVFVHYFMAAVLAGLVVLVYVAGGTWLYRRYLLRFTRRARIACLVIGGVGAIPIAAYVYVWAMPAAPEYSAFIKDKTRDWEKVLLGLDADQSGGLRYNRIDDSVSKQVWVTAQSLLAVLSSRSGPTELNSADVRRHVDYFHKKALPGGQGWGYMDENTWGVTEINAWVLLACMETLRPQMAGSVWGEEVPAEEKERIRAHIRELLARQLKNGAWSPVSVSDASQLSYARTYSSAMALWALITAMEIPGLVPDSEARKVGAAIRSGIKWLLATYDPQVGWVPNPTRQHQTERFLGLNNQVLFILARARDGNRTVVDDGGTYKGALVTFEKQLGLLTSSPLSVAISHLAALVSSEGHRDSEITARKVAVNERMNDSDRYIPNSDKAVETSTYLWYPWTLAVCAAILNRPKTEFADLDSMRSNCESLIANRRLDELVAFVNGQPFAYVMAENLFAAKYFSSNDWTR